jgi:hypothetical protein
MAKDKELIQKLAFHIAEEAGQLGHHEERWYNNEQRRKYEAQATNIVILLRNSGFTVESPRI